MEQTILTPTQERALSFISQEPQLAGYYLSGGTALAEYYLKHRLSDDLDFFSFAETNNIFLLDFAKQLEMKIGANSLRFERIHDRNLFFYGIGDEELKLEFSKYPFKQLEEPTMANGIKIDSFRDLAANKLMSSIDRFDPKDFVDLYYIFQRRGLDDVRNDVEVKFGVKIDDVFLGGELAKAKRIEALPKMLKPITIKEIKGLFSEKAKTLKPNILE